VRLTKGTDYGILGILYLAMQPVEQVTLLREVAENQEVPESYLAKIFQDLTKGGLVRSHRGARGGFSLARPAMTITLRQIIEVLQGPISLNSCLDIREGCPRFARCAVGQVLGRAQDELLQTLGSISLEHLAQQSVLLQNADNGGLGNDNQLHGRAF
jgi:Rrf2 family transcriptional regulator, iron-sulfur cluster assembly transcription factor